MSATEEQKAQYQQFVNFLAKNPYFTSHRRLRKGEKLGGLGYDNLGRSLYGVARAPQIDFKTAQQCIGENPEDMLDDWNAVIRCAARGVPRGARTAFSMPFDARLYSPSYSIARELYQELPQEVKTAVGDRDSAFIVDAAIDGQRLAAPGAFENRDLMARYLQYLESGHLAQDLRNYIRDTTATALREELQRMGINVGGGGGGV